MTALMSKPDTQQKLEILSADAQYDLACACGAKTDGHRTRGPEEKWIYPVTLPNGGTSVLFKTLISNACSNDCKYCPLRSGQDVRRCTLTEMETVNTFLDYYSRRKVFGLFLTSGVIGTPDATMEQLNRVARILRYRRGFRGYIHLKIIPGASAAAIEEAVSLSTAVSLNIETPGAKHLARLSSRKHFIDDIVEPIKLISRLTGRGSRYARVKQTTQFVVGAAEETDAEIVKYMWGLYDRLNLKRVYFSAYQKGLGDRALDEGKTRPPAEAFTREHRLYQVDFLMRKYGFTQSDIYFDGAGNLSLDIDPKEHWAKLHPGFFPLDINKASRFELLRVPGLGEISVDRILEQRKSTSIKSLDAIGRPTGLLAKAAGYLHF
ncbi:MAG TPA: radical SAM protein [Acidobacteriota bacterium]|nr:radical SAM protein [Acidobacteriota bacterium]